MPNLDWMYIAHASFWFVIGGLGGYVLGKVQCRCDLPNHHKDRKAGMRNEHGVARASYLNNVATKIGMAIVVVATVWAALQSTSAVRAVQAQQEADQQQQNIKNAEQRCTTNVLFDTIDALNQRTEFSGAQAQANIELQKAQLPLVRAIGDPTITDEEGARIVHNYLKALEKFLDLSSKQVSSVRQNPYPTIKGYQQCLADAQDVNKEGE